MNRKATVSALLLGLAVALPLPAAAWQTSISSPDGDTNASRIALTSTGDVIAGAQMAIGSETFGQIVILRFAGGSGTELWRTEIHGTFTTGIFGNSTLNSPRAIAVDASDNVIVGGTIDNSTVFDANIMFYVGKLSGATGGEIWRNELTEGRVSDLALDGAGNVIAVGTRQSGSAWFFFVVKLSGTTGAEIWRKEIAGASPSNNNDADAVAIDSSGNVIAVGEIEDPTRDFYVVKLAGTNGAEIWDLQIDDPSNKVDFAVDVAVDSAGDVLAIGKLSLPGTNDDEFFLVKLAASDGDEIWRQEITGERDNGGGESIAVDSNDDVIAAGSLSNEDNPVDFVAKFASDTGAEIWRHTEVLTGSTFFSFGGVVVDGDDDVVARSEVGEDTALLKLSGDDGLPIFSRLFPAKSRTIPGDFEIADDGSIVALAGVDPRNDPNEMLVIKFTPAAGGQQLLIQDGALDPKKDKIKVQVKDAQFVTGAPGGAADPTLVGATLTLKNPTTNETATFSLPAANWIGTGKPPGAKGYKYVDKKPLEGPCNTATLKNGQWKIGCGGAGIGYTLDEPSQGSVGATLTIGSETSCALFGGEIKKDTMAVGTTVGMFQAKNAPPPAECP